MRKERENRPRRRRYEKRKFLRTNKRDNAGRRE
jgi:hypothetical protein